MIYTEGEVYCDGCCDCGLVQKFYIVETRESSVVIAYFRDDRATGQMRRHKDVQLLEKEGQKRVGYKMVKVKR